MYTIRFFDEPARFLEEMRSQFELYETRNSLIHGVATKLAGDSKAYGPEQPLLAVVWNDLGIACFSALMTPPTPLIVQSEVDDGEAVSLFCTAALEAGWAIPGVNGQPARPFVGVVGAMFNRASPNLDLAQEFLEHYLITPRGLAAMDSHVPLGVPALIESYETMAADPHIAGAMKNIEVGTLMPNIPQMGVFWSAMESALATITSKRATPQEALDNAQARMARGAP